MPVMTRRGLRGVPSRGGLRGLGQDEVPPAFLFSAPVQAQMTAPGGPLNPSTAPVVPAVNAQGQTMADVLAAGGSPADLGPTIDVSQTGANIAPTMQTSAAGYVYGAADSVYNAAASAAESAVSGVFSGIPWWAWALGGAAGLILLVRSVK
jgi:hypothetical protein